jgi:hypothetical protein
MTPTPIVLQIGDIIKILAPLKGDIKFQLCLRPNTPTQAAKFLFLNSRPRFVSDLVNKDTEIPCLPPSKTGLSVISCSDIVLANTQQLQTFGATKMGQLPSLIARRLEQHILAGLTPFTDDEEKFVLAALALIR